MPSPEIARISMPSEEDFFRHYVFARRPVVITNLFEGQEISSIATIDDATRAWGTMRLHVQEEYTSTEGADPPTPPVVMSLREYVDFASANRSTRLCCTEYETPARVLAAFRLPAACRVTTPPDDEVFALPRKYGDFDLATNVFVANAGNVAHLHFDGDQREVLLHQVYGHKRVLLFPPRRDPPTHARRSVVAPVPRRRLSRADAPRGQLALVDLAGGCHTVLEPGETIYIPMLMWHHLE